MKIVLKPIEEYQRLITLRGFSWDSESDSSTLYQRFAHSSPSDPDAEGLIGFRLARKVK